MTTNRIGALQLVRFTPMAERLGVLPVHGLTHSSGPSGGTLTVTFSEVLYGELPDEVEVAVEQWTGAGWIELRDGRFTLTSDNADKADAAGMVRVTAQAVVPWMGEGANLDGVDPYRLSGLHVIAAKNVLNCSVSGSTFTKSSHGLASGDRVRVLERGKLSTKAISGSGVYYVRNITTNTFQISSAATGAVKSGLGSSSGDVDLERIRDQILATGHLFENGDKVSVQAADGSNLNDGSTYYIVRDGGLAFGVASQPGGVPIELDSNVLAVYKDLDGDRVFKGAQATAGYIIGRPFSEAQDRGWGPVLSRDFTGTTDSSGAGWVDVVEDEPGIPIGYKPGTTLTAMLNSMVDQQVAEFASEGRLLRLWNYGYGVERSLGNTPVVIGRAATAKPVKRDLNSLASSIRVRGEGPVQVDVEGETSAFGRREMYIVAAGVTTRKLATAIGTQKVLTTQAPLKQYAVTENAIEARFLADRDYKRGDYVLAHVSRSSGVPDRFRVVEIQQAMDNDGNVEISTILGDRITTSPLARLAAKARRQSGGISSGGNGSGIPVIDARQPAAPLNVTAESVGTFSETGAPMGSLVVTWSGVVADIDGLDIYADQYELWVREDGMLQGSPRSRTGGLLAMAGPYPSGRTVLVSVRARSSTGVWGHFSEEVEVVTATPIEPPLPPTAPTVTSEKGIVTVHWDGLLVDPDLGPVEPELGFDHVEVLRADSEFGTYGSVGNDIGRQGTSTDGSATVGEEYWYKLFAVTTVGVASAYSDAVAHTVVGVGEGDLDPAFLTTFTDGKNAVTFATTDPDPDPAGRTEGDLWFKRVGTVATGLWVWDGDSWETRTLDNAVLGTLDVAKLVAGAATIDAAVITKLVTELLTAGRIQSQMINVGAHLPTGAPSQRVSAPLTDLAFWAQVTSGAVPFTTWGGDTIGIRGVTAGTGGLVLTPTTLLDARLYLMQRARVPESGRVHTRLASSGANARLWVVWFTAAGAATEVQLTNNAEYVFDPTAVEYTVRVQLAANLAVETVAFATVFEAIGSATGQQRVTVSPSGLNAYADDGSGMVSIGTSTDQFISIWKDTGAGPEVQASIDADGHATLNDLALNNEMTVRGIAMFGTSIAPVYRNGAEDVVPLMQRFSLGGTRMGYFSVFTGNVTSAEAYKSLAYMDFQVTAGRQYRFSIDSAMRFANTGTGTAALEILVSASPIAANASTGYTLLKSVLIRAGNIYVNPLDLNRAMRTDPSIYTDLTLSPGTNYLMLRVRNPNASTIGIEETAGRGSILIEDVGPEFEELQNVTSALTSGTPATPGASVTTEFDATWSRSWIGSSIVSGGHSSSPGSDQYMLYQGLGPSTHHAAMFGFPALGISGKTISACYLGMQNRATYSSNGVTAKLGTSALTAAPASRPGARVNGFTTSFTRGQGKWFAVPSTLWTSIASGAIRSFVLGDPTSSSANEYGAFDGFGESQLPTLRVTYK